jgi:CheY-like chemotaxis protein
MPDGGTLRLRAYSSSAAADSAEQGRKVVLEVADTGVGMDAATKDRCLEPFFSTKGERGSGLGLAMVYGMSQRHGAELEIDSQVGRGTCVRLRFIARSASSGNGAVHPGHLPPGRPLRLLVIDDDPRVLASLSDALMSEGHMVEVALGGQAGIDQFRATRPSSTAFDAVITDLGMPHVDGRRVALEIRRVNARTPVILLTGWGQRLRDEGDVPEGVSLVLSKPARLQELRSAFDSLVAK